METEGQKRKLKVKTLTDQVFDFEVDENVPLKTLR